MNGHELATLRSRIAALEAERDGLLAELAYVRTDRDRLEKAYASAAAQAACYRQLRDEGYAQGRADERLELDRLASQHGPWGLLP